MRTLLITALLLTLTSMTACHSHSPETNTVTHQTGVYRHVVVFKFKATTTEAQISDIIAGFAELPKQIDTIIAFEHGKNISPEGLDQGFTHVFIVTFKDQAGLDIYLPHPAHKAFVEKLLPLLEEPFVVDYVAK